jgi:hypothetical protein
MPEQDAREPRISPPVLQLPHTAVPVTSILPITTQLLCQDAGICGRRAGNETVSSGGVPRAPCSSEAPLRGLNRLKIGWAGCHRTAGITRRLPLSGTTPFRPGRGCTTSSQPGGSRACPSCSAVHQSTAPGTCGGWAHGLCTASGMVVFVTAHRQGRFRRSCEGSATSNGGAFGSQHTSMVLLFSVNCTSCESVLHSGGKVPRKLLPCSDSLQSEQAYTKLPRLPKRPWCHASDLCQLHTPGEAGHERECRGQHSRRKDRRPARS